MSVPDDANTLMLIRAGDPAALTRWFESHVAPLHAFVYYRVGRDRDLAADATQSTFALALTRLDDYDPPLKSHPLDCYQ